MRNRLSLVLSLLCGWVATSRAQDVSWLYSREKLKADAARWGDQIRAEYRETILPQLTDEEKAALSAIKIEIPISGPKGDPFQFYSDGAAIYLPALSLRFFSDLCVANAWLNAHGFDGTTVRDYVGYLFKEAGAGHRIALPVLRTLGVPDNAREESAVANRVDRNFGNTIVFLLAHELGHVLKKHRTDLSDPVEKRNQEIEADQFAIEMMRRIGQVPAGVELWFDVERIAHVQGVRSIVADRYPSDSEWQKYLAGLDYPVTTERLNALAATIEKAPDAFAKNHADQTLRTARSKMLAQYFRLGAPSAAIGAARRVEYLRVQDLHVEDLKPRKSAFTIPGVAEHEPEFNGLFAVRRTAGDGEQDIVDLLLMRSSDDGVMGGYSNAKVHGFIEGKIKDGVLRFTWHEGNTKGSGIAQSEGDTLRGTWGTGDAEQGAGELKGVRVRPKKDSNPK
jgi:hypothetical protein